MFSNRRVEKFDDRTPELLHDLADNPRVQQIRGKIRTSDATTASRCRR